ncbi:suppressor of RPS4-RLD 1 isoform X2 [Phalaenopsis equestris]|uniref:suppressor of RPS4-RLD 1 isoform X2 n=1 Tax=Phalaenopsis equestris TaxID=78828 RepID=UPI0009E42AD3|nr:suppressor of RPS4-RLD 1 isoform X2 [Phalaenopsis equestris]
MTSSGERLELVKLCSSRNWSKAIRILDSVLSRSCSIQDLCNRAFCYSQLELHKHVIKDCDRALMLDPALLQAYILKGNAFSALGRKEDALHVWEEGYTKNVYESTDIKQLLILEELVESAKQNSALANGSYSNEFSNAVKIEAEAEVVPTDCKSDAIDCSDAVTCKLVPGGDSALDSPNNTILSTDTESKSPSKARDSSDICIQPCDAAEKYGRSDETTKVSNKMFVAGNTINLDIRLSRGIAQVNKGKYGEAISIFDRVLNENPKYAEALIGRGTAYAFKRELEAAIDDFTMAIKCNSSAGEAWKRRGQARAALGIVCFKFKDYHAAVEDLSSCVKCDAENKSAYTYLGLALFHIGENCQAEVALLKSIKLDKSYIEAWTHLAQFYQDLANPEKALQCLEQVLLVDERFAKAYHLRGLLYQMMGQHRAAIKDFSLGLSIDSSNIESLYLRASCYHAIGEYRDAVKDYDLVMDLENGSMDKFVLQCLAFYQKEITLYTASKASSEFCWFDIDGDVDPLFKEYWCKKLHPKFVCERVFRQPTLRDSLKKGRLKKQEFSFTKQKTCLLQAADLIGQKIQYNCPGFLPNKRQYRMAGLAAIEIAQKVGKAWRSLRNASRSGRKVRRRERPLVQSHNRGGVCCSTSSLSEISASYSSSEDKISSNRSFSWRDIYSIAVRWRLISEPCDPVVWIDKLSEEADTGFSHQTPILQGQAKIVRYFPMNLRTLDVAKSIIRDLKYVHVDDKIFHVSEANTLEKIAHVESCSDLYGIVGKSFWVATMCDSAAFEGKQLDGTQISIRRMGNKGFDFTIQTPSSSSRWEDYDTEMEAAWEELCTAYCDELYGSNDLSLLENVKDAILRMTYYWLNFKPLTRGSAVVGLTVMLGLFIATNMEVTASIPPGVQVDWEALLSPNPQLFINTIKTWLYPSLRYSVAWKEYPDVASTFSTTGSAVSALSNYFLS